MEFVYKIVSSMEKVFSSGIHIQELEEKKIAGLKGETVSFQIAYCWRGKFRKDGAFKIFSPIKDCVRIREVKLVPCEYPCHMEYDEGYLATEPGLYPDLLSEIGAYGFSLIVGQWRSLWVDVEIKKDMETGIYPLKIELMTKEEILCATEIEVEVLDVVLPKLPIPHTEWFHCDGLADYYSVEVFSEEHWRIMEEFVKTAVKHKCNMLLTPVFTPPLDTGVGLERRTVQLVDVYVKEDEYQFDFSKFRRWVEMAKRCGIEYFEISHLFSQWGAFAAPKIMAINEGRYQKIFGWETEASGEEYGKFLHLFLTALKAELKKCGIEKNTYFHISDEPNEEQLENYQKAVKIVEKDLEEYPVIDALSHYQFYKMGLVKQPVCCLDYLHTFLNEEECPEKLWGYYCTGQHRKVSNRFIVLPGYRTRILGVQLYKYQLSGFLHWGYNFYNSQYSMFPIDPYRCTDSAGAFPSGDPFLVYPGKEGKPEGSIRLMLMDEAMSDYCALKALEEIAGRETVMACIEEDAVIELEEYPQSSTWLLKMRNRIHQMLKVKYEGKKQS